jgi:hypothetical protein
MRDQLFAALSPLLLTLLTAACAWVARAAARYLARRTYALDTAALRDTARAVVADLQVAVDDAKDATRPGEWSPAVAASMRLEAIRRVRALSPLATRTVLTALDGDANALDGLLGAYIEDAVRSLRPSPATPRSSST